MPLMLLLGGARSGKSDLALRLARAQAAPVVFIATAEARDDEMTKRIAQHRRDRPADWTTIEEPLRLAETLAAVDAASCVVVDCLTLWTANMLDGHDATDIEQQAQAAAEFAAGRPGATIAISNEVGLGIVPDTPLGRGYRDLLGRVNTIWADHADHAYLLVAGRPVELPPESALTELVP